MDIDDSDSGYTQLPVNPLPLPPPETFSISPFTRKKRTKTEPTPKPPSRKPNPLAPKITRPCTECGKTFWSWKALFGHMRCHPERQWRGINPPPHLRRRNSPPAPVPSSPSLPSVDDREVAASLLLLASTTSIAKFECSGCKKTFPTHQALGGHRASHKNVKGCFANSAIVDGQNCNLIGGIEDLDLGLGLVLGLGHRCGVCFKVFSSGQALGGHKRCHWEKNEEASTSSFGAISRSMEAGQYGLDLNMPALVAENVGNTVCSAGSMQLDLRLGI